MEGVGHVIVVSDVYGIEELFDLRLSIQAREIAAGSFVGLVVLEREAKTFVGVRDTLAEYGEGACHCVTNECKCNNKLIHHLCSNLIYNYN